MKPKIIYNAISNNDHQLMITTLMTLILQRYIYLFFSQKPKGIVENNKLVQKFGDHF